MMRASLAPSRALPARVWFGGDIDVVVAVRQLREVVEISRGRSRTAVISTITREESSQVVYSGNNEREGVGERMNGALQCWRGAPTSMSRTCSTEPSETNAISSALRVSSVVSFFATCGLSSVTPSAHAMSPRLSPPAASSSASTAARSSDSAAIAIARSSLSCKMPASSRRRLFSARSRSSSRSFMFCSVNCDLYLGT